MATDGEIAGWIVERLLGHAGRAGTLIHAYCLMPDHLHVVGEGLTDAANFLGFVARFKQETGFEFVRKFRRKLWEKRFYDCVLREAEDLEKVCWYVWLNPVRRGICLRAADYKWSGSMSGDGLALMRAHRPLDWVPPWKRVSEVEESAKGKSKGGRLRGREGL